MLFTSREFLFVFLPVVVVGFFCAGRLRHGLAALWLAGAVLIALEWPYYLRDFESPTTWVTTQVLAWDAPYFRALNVARQAKFIVNVSTPQLRDAWLAKLDAREVLAAHPSRRLRSEREVLAEYAASTPASTFEYGYLNIDRRGDMRNTCGLEQSRPMHAADYGIEHASIDAKVLEYVKTTAAELEARGRAC